HTNELLSKISQDFSTDTIQVNSIAMKTPAVEASNLIMTHVQDKLSEYIAIKRKKVKIGKRASWRGEDKLMHPLVKREIIYRFSRCDFFECHAIFLNASISFGLEGACGSRIFPHWNQ